MPSRKIRRLLAIFALLRGKPHLVKIQISVIDTEELKPIVIVSQPIIRHA